MYLKILKNDFLKNPWKNLILFLFICLSAAIAVTVTLMLIQLFTSISFMYKTANPPHFLQMHKGELNQEDIDEFNSTYDKITYWQTVSMINFYGDELTISNKDKKQFTLSDCSLDISFVKQNNKYDVLLDKNRNRLELNKGEIGVPVILLDEFNIDIGDTLILNSKSFTKTFIVADYVYDGQMNSTLCSSTRFLISDADFNILFGSVGETEYLIEAWFEDSAQATDYQTAYEQSDKNLPKNGQAITYTMIFLLSALTDLMMAMVFLLAGVLLLVIAMICLRYAVLAELEQDMQEIGTMKAIGIPKESISKLYLGKVQILAQAGCIIGFLMALFIVSILTSHIRRTFGSQPISILGYSLAVFVSAIVYCIIFLFSKKVLICLEKVSITDLIVTQKGFGHRTKVRDGLHKHKYMPLSLLVGLHEVQHGYSIIFMLFLIVSFLITIPVRTVQTMEDQKFVTYMGSSMCDLLLEVEQGKDLEERNQIVKKLLFLGAKQEEIEQIDILRRVRLQVIGETGNIVGIHIDTGKTSGKGLRYLTGSNPKSEAEIALSYLMAEELVKKTGDTISLLTDGEIQKLTVCGIYQDVTSGGRTAKTICDFTKEIAEKYTYQINLSSSVKMNKLTASLQEQLGNGYSIENMEEFLNQTLGGVTIQVKQASYMVLLISICLTILITMLFLKLRITREIAAIAAKKTMGIQFSAIFLQELFPILIAGGTGSIVGVILAELFGDNLISFFFSIMKIGLKKIVFVKIPVWQFILIPALLLLISAIVTISICTLFKNMNVADYINE